MEQSNNNRKAELNRVYNNLKRELSNHFTVEEDSKENTVKIKLDDFEYECTVLMDSMNRAIIQIFTVDKAAYILKDKKDSVVLFNLDNSRIAAATVALTEMSDTMFSGIAVALGYVQVEGNKINSTTVANIVDCIGYMVDAYLYFSLEECDLGDDFQIIDGSLELSNIRLILEEQAKQNKQAKQNEKNQVSYDIKRLTLD